MKNLMCIYCILLVACQTTKVVYNDTSDVDDGEIFGSQLYLFFQLDDNIKVFDVKSRKLYIQLQSIKKQIIRDNSILDKDDNYYDYAFITSNNDTLYSNSLIIWRYKNLIIDNFELDDVEIIGTQHKP